MLVVLPPPKPPFDSRFVRAVIFAQDAVRVVNKTNLTPFIFWAEQIKTLKAGNTIKAAPERSEKRTVSAETPVTRKIMQKAKTAVRSGEGDDWQYRMAAMPGWKAGRA